jgi:hypothetical protein
MRLASLITAVLTFSILFTACPVSAEEGKKPPGGAETATYLKGLEGMHDKPMDAQIEGWRKFLQEHPDSPYRGEIEANVRNLEDLLANTDPVQQKEKKDTERYLRAVEYAKKLSVTDQISLWEQFLGENPQSIYRREAKRNLEELKARDNPAPDKPGYSPGRSQSSPPPQEQLVTPALDFKSPQTGALLATFPGLIVPGIGHWYVKEYMTAGILTGLRVAGLALGIPGIIRNNTVMIVLGAAFFGFTYIYDIADAPYAVARYNEALEHKNPSALKEESLPGRTLASISYSFSF